MISEFSTSIAATDVLVMEKTKEQKLSPRILELRKKIYDQEYLDTVKDKDPKTGKSPYDYMSAVGKELIDQQLGGTNVSREDIEAKIKEKELEYQKEQDAINRKIYLVSVKENAIEMEVKRLDTQISAIQQQLKAVEEAEGSAIERATPKFNGVG